jgi:hypothetical protein
MGGRWRRRRSRRSSDSPHLSLYHCRKRPSRPNVLSRPRPHAPPPGSLTENGKRPARKGVRLVGGGFLKVIYSARVRVDEREGAPESRRSALLTAASRIPSEPRKAPSTAASPRTPWKQLGRRRSPEGRRRATTRRGEVRRALDRRRRISWACMSGLRALAKEVSASLLACGRTATQYSNRHKPSEGRAYLIWAGAYSPRRGSSRRQESLASLQSG